MIFGINTTRDISKLSKISLAWRLVKLRITISKCHSWYLCQISLQIMLLPIQILENEIYFIKYTAIVAGRQHWGLIYLQWNKPLFLGLHCAVNSCIQVHGSHPHNHGTTSLKTGNQSLITKPLGFGPKEANMQMVTVILLMWTKRDKSQIGVKVVKYFYTQ